MSAAVTLPKAQAQLREWMQALERCSSGASYSLGGRTLTRQDVTTIRAEIQRWHNTVTALEAAAAGNCRPLGAVASFPAPGAGTGAGGLVSGSDWNSGAN